MAQNEGIASAIGGLIGASSTNIQIEKVSNGYIVRQFGQMTFVYNDLELVFLRLRLIFEKTESDKA